MSIDRTKWAKSKGKQKTAEADPQVIQTLELADKDFKIAVTGMFNNTEGKMEQIDETMENFTTELKSIFKKS